MRFKLMKPKLIKLISIASPQLCNESPQLSNEIFVLAGNAGKQLIEVLNRKNGFYAFESALHLFPAGCKESHIDLASWNQADSWRKEYGDVTSGRLFFAEDIFG